MQIKLIIMLGLTLVVSSLVGGLYYYKSQYEKVQGQLTLTKAVVASLKNANQSLKDQAAKVATEMNGYIGAMDKLSESNLGMSLKLGQLRNKLSKHKLTNLRNGRHSELVLKVINRSIVKQNSRWMALKLPEVVDNKPKVVTK